jgi:hypothetical protein
MASVRTSRIHGLPSSAPGCLAITACVQTAFCHFDLGIMDALHVSDCGSVVKEVVCSLTSSKKKSSYAVTEEPRDPHASSGDRGREALRRAQREGSKRPRSLRPRPRLVRENGIDASTWVDGLGGLHILPLPVV